MQFIFIFPLPLVEAIRTLICHFIIENAVSTSQGQFQDLREFRHQEVNGLFSSPFIIWGKRGGF